MRQPLHHGDARHDAAFQALFRAHYAELCAFAHRYVRSRAIAEEIVQDVFLRIWKRREKRAIGEIARAYLYRATRNESLKHVDRARVEKRSAKQLRPRIQSLAPSAEQDWVARSRAAAVRRAIDGLPPRCKEIFLAIRLNGLRYAEVARMLGISPKTVEAQMTRAVKLLRERLTADRPE